MAKICWFLLVSLVSFAAQALEEVSIEQKLQSLEQALITEPAQTEQLITDLGEQIQEMSDSQRVRYYSQIGIKAILDANYQKSIGSFNLALELAGSLEEKVTIHYFMATAELSVRDYAKSLTHLSVMLQNIDNIDDAHLQVKSYNRLFNAYFQLGAHQEAAEYALLAHRLNAGRDPISHCTSSLFIGLSAFKLGDKAKALSWLNESVEYCEKHQLPLMVAMSHKGTGELLFSQDKFSEALAELKQAEAGYAKIGYQIEIVSVDSMLAQTYAALGHSDDAISYAMKAFDKAGQEEYMDARKRAVRVLADINYLRGNFQQAYDYQQIYLELTETMLSDIAAKSLAFQLAKFDSDEKDRHIHLLEQERGVYVEQRATEHQKQSNLTLLLLVAAAGLMICLIVIILGYTQRGRYKRMAQYDSLTGVMNRSTGFTKAENTYVSVMARHSVMSAIMVDLDAFKAVNDQHGHSTGDWALRMLVDGIKAKLRRMDILVRLSGEEFAIFLPDMPATDAESVAESIRLLVMEMEPRYAEEAFKLTASLGVSVSNEGDLSLDPILARADIALHQAKESGGNQVVVYGRHSQEV